MSRIFLGPWVHWVILAVLVGLAWVTGLDRLHVSKFNLFISAMILMTIVVLVLVIKSSPQGKQVTRDPIEDDTGEEQP